MRAAIIGTGMYVPPRIVTNDEMTRMQELLEEAA